jgi:hypothetical protein
MYRKYKVDATKEVPVASHVIVVVLAMSLLGWTRLFGQSVRSAAWSRAIDAYASGRFDEADQWAADVLTREATRVDAQRLRGTIALWRNDVKTAEFWLRGALAREPRNRLAAGLLAEALTRQDRFNEAAPFAVGSGDRARGRMLASFGATRPYRLEGEIGARPLLQVDPLPLVELTINEAVSGVFLVDTGGADTIIDPAIATRLRVQTFGGERGGLFAGGKTARIERARLASLRFGAMVLRDLPAVVMPTRALLVAPDGRPLDGVLGTSVLRRFASTIDYARGGLVLAPRVESGQASCRAITRVPFWLVDDHYIVASGSFGTLDHQMFIVDTGVGGAAVAPSEAVLRKAGIVPEAPTSAVGPGGGLAVRPFTVPRLALSAYAQESARGLAGVFPASLTSALRFDVAGFLGHDFFRGLRVTFDFDRMEILLCTPAS